MSAMRIETLWPAAVWLCAVQAMAAAAQAELLKQQEELEKKAAELERKEQVFQNRDAERGEIYTHRQPHNEILSQLLCLIIWRNGEI